MNDENNPIDKNYHPESIEKKWYQHWEQEAFFKPKGSGNPYCIMLPPPNVTGSLHMGHGFQHTLMDILIRYHRMRGDNTLWQVGTDHAGIATQMVVERRLAAQGISRHELGRETFLEKIWEWKAESGGNIVSQMRRLGASADWSRERFTLDKDLSHAVSQVFIQLYEEGLIYRGERLVNWDPKILTAISDLEVINEEEDGNIWHIRYPLVDSEDFIVVATTRPETLLGDVAVAVHPDDARYQHLIGKKIHLPLTNRQIPIIADDYVDPEFGSGCVKITPAHDFNDFAVGMRHDLKPINIFTPNAHLNENAPPEYQGLERFAARKQIVNDLETNSLIEKIEKHKIKIPRGEKTGAVIEPYLTKQWFMKMKPLAIDAIKAVQNKEIQFIPENWDKTYFQWMENIEDWCISRQLWWGHRIPIWYDDKGKIYVGNSLEEVRKRHDLSEDISLTQDTDVLDTWFSSALWPFSSLGWPKETADLKTFFPTDVLVTGFDIIFFWVARMIMMSLKFTKQIPFKEIYITGLIRDAEGQKMSKSKGNVLDPIDLIDGIDLETLVSKRTYGLMQPKMAEKIEKSTRKEFPQGIPSFGTDALRFTFCSFASFTREIRFDINRLMGYRNFCNKLWNASRYVLMNTENYQAHDNIQMELTLADRFIRSRLQKTIVDATYALQQYRFDHYAQILYDFTWNEFCDWYLELSKPILTSPNSSAALLKGTQYTLLSVLETVLRLLHPIIPFITEEIWQRLRSLLNKPGQTIMLEAYPSVDKSLIDEKAESELNWLKNFIIAIRTIRSEKNIPPGKALSVLLRKGDSSDKKYVEALKSLLLNLARLESITWIASNDTPPSSASAFVNELEIFIPLAGFLNKEEEISRLNKDILKLEKEFSIIENKLKNPQFIDRAPAEVVSKEKEKLENTMQLIAKLKNQLQQVERNF